MSNGTLAATATYREPGIYHDLPFADYLADPSLSASGIRDLAVSPLTYWTNSPLNPNRERRASSAMIEGTAFHKRILEGCEAFNAAYGMELDKADFPEALKSGEELRACCKAFGLKTTGTLAEMSERIRGLDRGVLLWVDVEATYAKLNEGKEALPVRTLTRIQSAARAIESNPATAALFRDGSPEVSIFWIDGETGVPLKARLDYLNDRGIADLKTFSNPQGRPLMDAVAYAMASGRYGTQAVMYLDAVTHAGLAPVPDRFVFCFLENGPAANILVREFCRDAIYAEIVEQEYRRAIQFYAQCLDRWGTDRPWVSPAVIEPFRDEDFPLWSYRS